MADANFASPWPCTWSSLSAGNSQAGTPHAALWASTTPTRAATLMLSQSCRPPRRASRRRPFVIPVAPSLTDGRALPLQLEGEAAAGGNRAHRVLTEPSAYAERGQPARALAAARFQRPAILDCEYGDAELLALLTHDGDAFNRWEAGQPDAHRYHLNS